MIDTLTPFRSLLQQTYEIMLQHQDQLRACHLESAPAFSPFHFIKWGEVPVTHMLAYFLDSQQSHGQQAAFQDSFVAAVQAKLSQYSQDSFMTAVQAQPSQRVLPPQTLYKVVPEKRHGEGNFGQIDLLLTSSHPRFALCIENKPHSGTADQWRQLEAYHEFLTGIDGFGDNYLLIYLSDRPRNPSESSLEKTKREVLQQTGHYLNLTYETFLLPLLSEWAKVARPEKVSLFLLDFRYQVERQLNFPSTSPTATMYQDDIAKLLLQDTNLLKAAYELPNALKAAEKQLGKKLGQEVLAVAKELQLQPISLESEGQDFVSVNNGSPHLLTKLTWGQYKIGLEFTGPKLDVGVIGDDKNSPVGQELMKRLGDTEGNDIWACWESLYNTDFKSLYIDVANGEFKNNLRSRVTALCQVLDALQSEGLLTEH